jgi:outer membrane protein TolC
METVLSKLQLDIEEIRATSASPRNELDASLVGQRDFVRERLALELENAQRALVAAERAVDGARVRVEVGTGKRAALLQAEAQLAQARSDMQRLRAMLDMRQRALRGEIKGDDLARQVRRIKLTLELERAQRELKLTRERVDELRRSFAVGMTGQLDLKRAEVELLEHEVELKRLRDELDKLGSERK